VDADIYRRDDLGTDAIVSGPAIIEEYGSTVPVHPGYRVRVDAFDNLVVTRDGGGS
jgi:N-methylhydantoinase A